MLIRDTENSFTAAEACAGTSSIVSKEVEDTMDTEKPEPKGKQNVVDIEEEMDAEDEEELRPIVIDGGCLCSLLRYQINIPVEFQKTELYKQIVGFAHCYCHPCKCAVSALTRTSLKFPREMVQWTTRAKLVEPEPESPASSTRQRRGSRSTSNTPTPIAEADKSSAAGTSENAPAPSSSQPKEIPEKVTKRAERLQSKLEAIKQDPEFDTEFAGVDNTTGCCCYEEDNVSEITTPKSPVWGTSRKPSLGTASWSGNAGYHRRIWKRERGVGGKPIGLGEPSPLTTAPASPAPSTPKYLSPSVTPRTQSPLVEQLEKSREKGKEKAKTKEGLWTKMKGKASAAISSKEKDKVKGKGKLEALVSPSDELSNTSASQTGTPKSELAKEACPAPVSVEVSTGCDIISPPANPQPSSLEILRWEAQLLYQQQSDLSCGPCTSQSYAEDDDGDPKNNTLPIPWPFKEFAITTRDGRTSYRGFCSWCGGSLTYRTSASLHGMVDIHVGSMDDPARALREVGFVREVHIETSGGVEEGARLGTTVGHWRDGAVDIYASCDMERRLRFDSDSEAEAGETSDHGRSHEDVICSDEEL